MRDHDDAAFLGVVQARHHFRVKTSVDLLDMVQIIGFIYINRVVENEQIGAVTGDRSVDRRRINATALRCRKVGHLGTVVREAGLEDVFVPARSHNGSNAVGDLVGQRFVVGHDQDMSRRFATQHPGCQAFSTKKCLEVARRHIDDQPLSLVFGNFLEFVAEIVDIGVVAELLPFMRMAEGPANEGGEVGTNERI